MTTPTASTATSLEPHADPVAQPVVLPQFGIFAQGTHAHHFLAYYSAPSLTALDAVR